MNDFSIAVSALPSNSELSIFPFDTRTDAQELAAEVAMADWAAIAPELSAPVRELANQFVALCTRLGALTCRPGCVLDALEGDSVLFDWNDGHRPILSVMITSRARAAFAGRFKNGGKVSGEEPDLVHVEKHLQRMMHECGHPIRTTGPSPVLSMSGRDAVATGVRSYSFRQQTTESFQYSRPMMLQTTIWNAQAHT